jgi:hypothetical protein
MKIHESTLSGKPGSAEGERGPAHGPQDNHEPKARQSAEPKKKKTARKPPGRQAVTFEQIAAHVNGDTAELEASRAAMAAQLTAPPTWEGNPVGRLASSVASSPITWLLDPWIPLGFLTLLVGSWGVGKSCLNALLMSIAGPAVYLPGDDERFGKLMISRLLALGYDLHNLLVLDDREYNLRDDWKCIASAASQMHARLVLFDPIEDFLPEGTEEKSNLPVKKPLGNACKIAAQTGAAVVGVRHPGLTPGKILPDSRAWGNMPKAVHLLTKEDGPPERRVIQPYKYQLGAWPAPRLFTLPKNAEGVPVFTFGEEIDPTAARIASEVTDRLERQKVDLGTDIIRANAEKGKIDAQTALASGRREDISGPTMYRACEKMGWKHFRDQDATPPTAWWCSPEEYERQVALRSERLRRERENKPQA